MATCEELKCCIGFLCKAQKRKQFFPGSFQLALITRVDFLFLKHTVVADKAFPEVIASVCKDKNPSVPNSERQPCSTQNFYHPWQVAAWTCSEQWRLAVNRQGAHCLTELLPLSLLLTACPGGRHTVCVSWAETSNTSQLTTGTCLARAENDAYT